MKDFHITLTDLDNFAPPTTVHDESLTQLLSLLGNQDWSSLFESELPVIRLVLLDQTHLVQVSHTQISQLLTGGEVGDHDPVIIIAIGANHTVEVAAGFPFISLAAQTIKLPTTVTLGSPTDNQVSALFRAIYDLHVIGADEEVSKVVIYPYLNWDNLPKTYQALAAARQAQHINIEFSNEFGIAA